MYEFPIREIAVQMPAWVTMLESGHWLQSAVYTSMLDFAASVHRMADLAGKRPQLGCEYITAASLTGMDLASGSVSITAAVAPDIFYKILGEQTGLDIVDEASLLPASSAWPGPSAPMTRSNPPLTRSRPRATASSCRALMN